METKLQKNKSKIHGVGIFAGENIAQGDGFYQVPLDEVYAEPKPRCARVGEGKYVSDEKVFNYVNHSCEPNAKLYVGGDVPMLVALHDIKEGEEVTVDYNETEADGEKVPCICGAENCRGYFLINR